MEKEIDVPLLKNLMIRASRRAYAAKIQSGDGGNLSLRIPGHDGILIKASGCSFGDMGHEQIVEVDFDGRVQSDSSSKPSRELGTHLAIYKARPDVDAIFHSHSPWATAASQVFEAWPAVSLPLDLKIGEVPVVDAGDGHADSDAIAAIQSLLAEPGKKNLRAFVQRRHGIFCMANTIIKAEHDAELVEEAAQIAMLVRLGGRI